MDNFNFTVLDKDYPDIGELVLKSRDTKYMGHKLRKIVHDLGRIEGEVIIASNGDSTENVASIHIPRAGLSLGAGLDEAFKCDDVGFISTKRDEITLKPKIEYWRIPSLHGKRLNVADSMLATGGSIEGSLRVLYDWKDYCGVPNEIAIVCAVSSEYGVNRILESEVVRLYRDLGTDIEIITGTLISCTVPDGIGPGLNNKGFILNEYGPPRDYGDDMYGKSIV